VISSAFTAESVPAIPWWLVLLQGIASAILGLMLLTETGLTLFVLVVFLGIYWLISGIFDLVGMFMDRSMWGWKLFSGVIGILAGVMIVRHPLWAAVLVPATVVWILAFFGIVIGVITIVRALAGAGWGAGILGAISLLLGVLMLFNTVISTVVLIYVVAACLLIGGIVAIAASFWLRSLERGAGPEAAASQRLHA
jgi:uncharacterized membrane protein HdeD (DUF308 family)